MGGTQRGLCLLMKLQLGEHTTQVPLRIAIGRILCDSLLKKPPRLCRVTTPLLGDPEGYQSVHMIGSETHKPGQKPLRIGEPPEVTLRHTEVVERVGVVRVTGKMALQERHSLCQLSSLKKVKRLRKGVLDHCFLASRMTFR